MKIILMNFYLIIFRRFYFLFSPIFFFVVIFVDSSFLLSTKLSICIVLHKKKKFIYKLVSLFWFDICFRFYTQCIKNLYIHMYLDIYVRMFTVHISFTCLFLYVHAFFLLNSYVCQIRSVLMFSL